VWITSVENSVRWEEKISTQYFLTTHFNHQFVGFGSIEAAFHLSFSA
jgi:hypothetical protein